MYEDMGLQFNGEAVYEVHMQMLYKESIDPNLG